MLYDDFLADPEVTNKNSLAALRRWVLKGGDYKDNFFKGKWKVVVGAVVVGGGEGGRVVEMVGVGEVEGLGMEQGEMDK